MAKPGRNQIHALFQKRLAGDDALLALTARRFQEAGLGAELYASGPAELAALLAWAPAAPRPLLHLPRGLDLLQAEGRELVLEFARQAGGRVSGLVVHDQTALLSAPQAYRAALAGLGEKLRGLAEPPWLFIEYAVGLDPEPFCRFFAGLDLELVSLCLDLGHLAIWQVRELLGFGPGQWEPLPELAAIAAAVRRTPDLVAGYFALLAGYGKPVHLHLHDGHPLAPRGPYGVADHLDFFAEIPLNAGWRGRSHLPGIYGPLGLRRMVRALRRQLPAVPLSWTMEIHPRGGRLPLGPVAAELFPHWLDLTHAEESNFWLDTLLRNCQLLEKILDEE